MKLAKSIVKHKVLILVLTLVLLVPSLFGYLSIRINYDMLTYLPKDMETVKGQDELMQEFKKGAFAFIVVENMSDKDTKAMIENVKKIDHVDTVIGYDSIADLSFPKEMLPEKFYKAFNTDKSTLVAVFFDSSTSEDATLKAIKDIRATAGKQCFVSGMSALVNDLKDLCEKEEPIYVGIAVLLACAAMMILLDNWLIPFIFLASIGMMILLNLGSNYFLGEISYITKALSAVLQLAVTMDYSIFLWHSYNEEKLKYPDKNEAMAVAIKKTWNSVLGSSITTVAGFIALCFMSFTLGKDLGIVMAKGVILGVLGCVTVLPSLILIFDKPLSKLSHKSIIPNTHKMSKGLVKIFPVFLIIFVLLITPAYYGYSKTNSEVYYDMGQCLPEDIDVVIANSKLSEEFDIASTHMVLVNSSLPTKTVHNMIDEMEQVKGVKYVLSLESVIGSRVPEEILPDSVRTVLKSDKWELMLINSEYHVASDNVNNQIDSLNSIIKKYDKSGMLIGEAPCMKDMIETTDHDFKVVNAVSIALIFLIILLNQKSLSLPFILISVIELAIFINLGLPHYMNQQLPFIAPICISTIQLGATVDYAILLTTRYKAERVSGLDKKQAVSVALGASIPSIIVSGLGLFAATFGVAVYSDIDIISSMCMLMARGAVISIICVIFFLPALLILFDKVIIKTTLGMKIKSTSNSSKGSAKKTYATTSADANAEATNDNSEIDRALNNAFGKTENKKEPVSNAVNTTNTQNSQNNVLNETKEEDLNEK